MVYSSQPFWLNNAIMFFSVVTFSLITHIDFLGLFPAAQPVLNINVYDIYDVVT